MKGGGQGMIPIRRGRGAGLEMPVVCRAGPAVGLLDVNLRDAGVVLHHLQRAVPELRLQGEHITARPQIGNGKRVPAMPSSA